MFMPSGFPFDQDSLGGNAKTSIVACVHPDAKSVNCFLFFNNNTIFI